MVPEFLGTTWIPMAFRRERKEANLQLSAGIVNKRRTHTLLTLHAQITK